MNLDIDEYKKFYERANNHSFRENEGIFIIKVFLYMRKKCYIFKLIDLEIFINVTDLKFCN